MLSLACVYLHHVHKKTANSLKKVIQKYDKMTNPDYNEANWVRRVWIIMAVQHLL